jgi:four helix bundle protein
MATAMEDLRVLQMAEVIADTLWGHVAHWDAFARSTMGEQLVRAADSIGANIAESFGRFHYGEKLNFLYYARGSLFETKYWINRSKSRQIVDMELAQNVVEQLSDLAHKLNIFASSLKQQRRNEPPSSTGKRLREASAKYRFKLDTNTLFSSDDLVWLKADSPNNLSIAQSPNLSISQSPNLSISESPNLPISQSPNLND